MESLSPPQDSSVDRPELVFLLDVDNTLLDNDALKAEIGRQVEHLVGAPLAERFWETYEAVRQERDYVDYPGTIARFTDECGDEAHGDRLQQIFDELPFASFLYPGVLETLQHLWSLGTVTILSDGDQVFQPIKIRRSGLEAAVRGNVQIYVHKEAELSEVFARFPAEHYVIVDDKARILSILEANCPSTFTTIFVLQGHYAREGEYQPAPDLVIEHIADLARFSRDQFLHPVTGR